jgi:hypothetical protein
MMELLGKMPSKVGNLSDMVKIVKFVFVINFMLSCSRIYIHFKIINHLKFEFLLKTNFIKILLDCTSFVSYGVIFA